MPTERPPWALVLLRSQRGSPLENRQLLEPCGGKGQGRTEKPQARFQPKSAFTFDFGSRPMVLALVFMFSGLHLVWAPVTICVSRARLRHMRWEVGTQVFLQTGPSRGRSCCWDEPVLMQVPGSPAGLAWPPAPHPWRYRWPTVAAEVSCWGPPFLPALTVSKLCFMMWPVALG